MRKGYLSALTLKELEEEKEKGQQTCMHKHHLQPHPNNKISQLLIREQCNHILTALLWTVIICVEHTVFNFYFVLNIISDNIFF